MQVQEYIESKTNYVKDCAVDDFDELDVEGTKMLMSEIESWQFSLESLQAKSAQLTVAMEKDHLMGSVAAVAKCHAGLLAKTRKLLDGKLAFLENSKEVDEYIENAEVWIAAKSQETLSCLEHHPLKSSAIKSQIMQVNNFSLDEKPHKDTFKVTRSFTIEGTKGLQ